MGIAERKERQKAELRELILEAARRIVDEEGLQALTMRKIAEAIEYSPATIYLHFENRDDIALQLVREGFEALLRHLVPAAAIADPLERVEEIGRRYLAFAEAEPARYRLIFMENARLSSAIMLRLGETADNPGDGAFALLERSVAELIACGRWRGGDARLVASLLWSSLHGIAALKLSCPNYPFPASIREPGEALIAALTRGFTA